MKCFLSRVLSTACAFILFAIAALSGTVHGSAGTTAAGDAPVPKRLNNFVVELLNLDNVEPRAYREFKFLNPRKGWIFISAAADAGKYGRLTISIDSAPKDEAVVAMDKDTAQPAEAMRFLDAGDHKINVWLDGDASIKNLVVRSIPELAFCKFQYNPHVVEYGAYDWDYLKKHVLDNVNTMVGSGDPAHEPYMREWKKQGKKWMIEYGVPGLSKDASVTADEAYKYWTESYGFQSPLADGALADEFLDSPEEKYKAWTEAVKRISEDGAFKNKSLYPYWNPSLYSRGPRDFAQMVVDAGFKFAIEKYLKEQPTEEEANKYLENTLKLKMKEWKSFTPNAGNYIIFALGYLSAPPESLNTNPSVDYKVWMDMQFNYLAGDPAFKNLYGVLEYTSGYADEEIVRWASKLYRHYCIEGKKGMLSTDPYILTHIKNPDFNSGAESWTLSPAEKGAMEVRNMKGYGWLQGRYPSSPEGDNFLRSKRSGKKPNTFSQEIRNLQPGRLYSIKMFTADYKELTGGKSSEQKHAVSIKIEGAAPVDGVGKSFQHVFPNCYGHSMGPFNDSNRAWMNYHQRVFRAKAETAKLVVSDWASDTEPGGEIGQELMFNFLEIQPYMEN
jgi:hypothetical protein